MPHLSEAQQSALAQITDWYHNPNSSQVFKLMGYAGTGKTTLAKELPELLGCRVIFAAYTGKAAAVLSQKGCLGAQTIHSLVYLANSKSGQRVAEYARMVENLVAQIEKTPTDALRLRLQEAQKILAEEQLQLNRPSFRLNPDSEIRSAGLVVLDEVSMIAEDMAQDVLSFGKKLLVLGDPAQLPPVFGAGYFVTGEPDILLTEIHRQAAQNPLIQLAAHVRNRRVLIPGEYGPNRVLLSGEPLDDDVRNFDQILVGKNVTRRSWNARMREILGFTAWHPLVGDRLICLRNNRDLGLQNGTLWHVSQIGPIDGPFLAVALTDEQGFELTTQIHLAPFRGRDIPFYERREAQEFDFGYAITVHKSQGSQWDNVLLYDESESFREDRFRWLYTGLTRAAQSVTVLSP